MDVSLCSSQRAPLLTDELLPSCSPPPQPDARRCRRRSQITWSFAPTQVLALMARQNPDWQNLQRMFPLVVKWTEQSDTNVFDGSALILSPHGVTTEIHPLTEVNRAGLGLSAFNRSDLREAGREADAEAERAAAIAAINDQMAPTITGPFELQLPNGASGTVIQIRVPIVIDNVTDPGERFGLDFDAPVDCRGDADCERRLYDPESKQKFWGFALGVSSIDAVLSAELRDLKQAGYAYRLVALRPDGSEDPAAAAAPITQSDGYAQAVRQPPRASRWSPPMTPVQSDVVVLQGLVRWRLYAVPVDGWVPAWRSWVLAWMVIGSSLLSGLTFLLLLSQKNHQELLRALLPQQMIRGMRQAAALSARHAEAQAALLGSTPAEKVLQMLACLLDGRPPELQDIMLVRAAIMQVHNTMCACLACLALRHHRYCYVLLCRCSRRPVGTPFVLARLAAAL